MMAKFSAALAIAGAMMMATSAGAVTNGDFSMGTFGVPAASSPGAESPATAWYFNTGGIIGELLTSFGGRSNVLHLTTTGDGEGIYQFLGTGQYGLADIYVASGAVRFYVCNAYCTNPASSFTDTSSTTASWASLTTNHGATFVDETALYSFGGAADFYIDTVSISDTPPPSDVPEPASWAMMIGGFGIAGMAMRRRRQTAIA